jgi:uncharacterized Zn-finger protein
MSQKAPCLHKEVHVTKAQLPLSCPQKDETLWNAHPKIFLTFNEDSQEATCPYCETHYFLID